MRHTKIIATLGPATDSTEKMRLLLEAGVNLVRLNFSHGPHEEHKGRIDLVRKVAEELGLRIGLLADLQGPKIRVASFKNKKITLQNGAKFCLDAELASDAGDETMVGIDYKELPQDVKDGDILLLDDGRLKLIVDKVSGNKINCTVMVGGVLSNNKGINRQGGGLSAPALTEKDIIDMQFAISQNVDYIAISFPRDASDMEYARQVMQSFSGKAGLIAKIERFEAIGNLDKIIKASDGVMVARGDLAVEVGDENVPLLQKHIIQRSRALDKPVITATQMMESMIESTVPTRAEVSDVANAVIDHTDAVMLSAESAVGKHPHIVVSAMARACIGAEASPISQTSGHRMECKFKSIDEAAAMATMYTANHLDIKAIAALTESGATPLWMSRIRTAIPIYGFSRHDATLGRMTLYRGVQPIFFDVTQMDRSLLNRTAVELLEKKKIVKNGDQIIITKGDYQGVGGHTNALKILVVGKVW
jgi:pyruvate kinase